MTKKELEVEWGKVAVRHVIGTDDFMTPSFEDWLVERYIQLIHAIRKYDSGILHHSDIRVVAWNEFYSLFEDME